MSNFTLADVSGVIASYGRGVVFYANKWDAVSPLVMSQLGVTEGDISVNPNGATAGLTLPELTGPIPHEMDYLGENPVIEIPLYSDKTVAYDSAGVWTFDGQALTTDQQRLLDASFWIWRAVFNRPTRRFRGGAGDDKKNIETVSTQAMHHPDLPEGHHIYTTGDPFQFDIDLNGMS